MAKYSNHTHGSTVDLTLFDKKTGKDVDMGGVFDYFGSLSHHGAPGLTPEQLARRNFLKASMQSAGFRAVSGEWWHYTLKNQPYKKVFFDFPVR